MSPSVVPTVDPCNPMYCPEVPAARYLQQLQQMRQSSGNLDTFSRRISMDSEHSQNRSVHHPQSEATFNNVFLGSSTASHVPTSPTVSFKRKRDLDFGNVAGLDHRAKRIHSDLSQTSSFVLSPDPQQPYFPALLEAAPLQDSSDTYYLELFKGMKFQIPQNPSCYSPQHVAKLEHELYGRMVGTESPKDVARLLQELDRELPGISLTHQFAGHKSVTHQDIVDLLSINGHLGRHILEYFRGTLIHHLNLSTSLSHEDGLNLLKPQIVLDTFSLPHSFTQLRLLNLDCVSLDDFDLTRIHHLPSLDTLWLNDTGIGNEAIGHLTALKHRLKELHVEENDRIDDDCIPSMCLLSSLVLLRTFGTSIQMPGLRRLAAAITQAGRELDIEIPQHCDMYLNALHTQYELHPSAPLIIDPHACSSLTSAALRANLRAHAFYNPSIYLAGSQPELADRLRRILEIRLADHVAKQVVWGYECSGDPEVHSCVMKAGDGSGSR